MNAVRQMRKALSEVKPRSIENWSRWAEAGGPERRVWIGLARAFLGGGRLEDAENVFKQKYREQLRDPKYRAALAWVYATGQYPQDPLLATVLREYSLGFAQSTSRPNT